MSQAEFGRLLADAKRDPDMLKEFKAVTGNQEAWFRLANLKGYDITAADAMTLQQATELSDADLEKVAGGWSIGCDTNTINPTWGC